LAAVQDCTTQCQPTQEFTDMDWDRIEGNWKAFKGKAKQQWGRLTDDDLNMVEGRRDELEGRIQQQYGFEKDRARSEIDNWLKSL